MFTVGTEKGRGRERVCGCYRLRRLNWSNRESVEWERGKSDREGAESRCGKHYQFWKNGKGVAGHNGQRSGRTRPGAVVEHYDST